MYAAENLIINLNDKSYSVPNIFSTTAEDAERKTRTPVLVTTVEE